MTKNNSNLKSNRDKGFTMIEVVIVLAIVGFLGYLASGAYTRNINNAHIVVAQNFLGTQAPRAILSCSNSNPSVDACTRNALIDDWGLGKETSTKESWSSVENKYGVTLTYPFIGISDASNTMSQVVTYLESIRVGSISVVSAESISVFYSVR